MKKLLSASLIFCLIYLAFLKGALIVHADNAVTQNAATIIGDSLTARANGVGGYANPTLQDLLPNASIDGVVDRQWSTGLTILQGLAANNTIKPILVFALGTNGDIAQSDIDAVLQSAGSSHVFFMTIYGVSHADHVNQLVTAAASQHSGTVGVIDWNSVASQHPEWFTADPVHPSAEGTQALANLIAQAVAGSSTTPGNGSANRPTQTTNLGSFQYVAPYSSGIRYVCKGSDIYDENANDKKASCGDSQQACYALDDQAGKTTYATCIANNPTGPNQCPSGSPNTPSTGLASCKFTRGTDTAVYQSQKLLGYFQEVSKNTGVPATVLAAITKIESTVPNEYSISDYTDSDVAAMDDTSGIVQDVDAKISGTNKARCPVSPNAAIGLMQVLAPTNVLAEIKQHSAHTTWDPVPSGSPLTGINQGLFFARQAGYKQYQSYTDLHIQDMCDPKLALYLGAGIVLEKLHDFGTGDGQNWQPAWTTDQTVIEKLARIYYGDPDGTRDPVNTKLYADSFWQSVSTCNADATTSTSSTQCTNPGGGTSSGQYVFPVKADYIAFPKGDAAAAYASIGSGNYSYVCGHGHPIYNAIDIGVNPAGGTPVVAVVDGDAYAYTYANAGPSIRLLGSDGLKYTYEHLRNDLGTLIPVNTDVPKHVKAGDVIGYISAAADSSYSMNNGIAHVHFSVAHPNVEDSLADPADIPAGPLLDKWGSHSVCRGANYNIDSW